MPQSWQDQIVSKFERLEVSPFPEQAPPSSYHDGPKVWHDHCLPKYDALLKVLDCTAVHPSTNARIAEILLRKLKLALRPSSNLAPDEAHFSVGRGFQAYSRMSKAAGQLDESLEPLLRAAAPRYARLPTFLEAMLAYENSLAASRALKKKTTVSVPHGDEDDLLVASLAENLSSESHQLRLLSLRLLEFLYSSSNDSTSEVIATMLLIENTPLDLQTARSASMHIRKLATMYQNHTSNPMLTKAMPNFCFGMLTVRFAQIWEDASASLAQMAQTKVGETIVAELAFNWLEVPSKKWDGHTRPTERNGSSGLTDFECSNLIQLDETAMEVESQLNGALSLMLQAFENEQSLTAARPSTARPQALRVLSGIPHIAEKRSRQLVPMFLSFTRHEDSEHDEASHEGEEDTISNWTRKDQKALLDLFAQFNNPSVLYKSGEVHSALLALLENGDIDIQKSALKAIFTWKFKGIKPYEENLMNLLDEARFKDEITILLQNRDRIQLDHKAELFPVLLRVLYGRTIARKGAASGKSGMNARRLTVLRNLDTEETGAFLDIALANLKGIQVTDDHSIFDKEILSVRKQVGFIHMMEAVLKELGSHVAPYTRDLLSAILYCVVYASRKLQADSDTNADDEESTAQTSLLRVVRQTGLRCLILLFTNDVNFEWSPYLDIVLNELVSPRIENLPIETGQSVSGLLQLLSTWSSSPKTVLFLSRDLRIVPKIAECIVPPKSQDTVKLFSLGIIKQIITIAQDTTTELEKIVARVKTDLLDRNMDTVLSYIGGVLRSQHDISKDLLEGCVETVSALAPFVSRSTQAQNLVDIATFLLDQPTRRVNPKTKSGLLLVLEYFVPLYDLQEDTKLKDRVYNTITSLFGFFKDQVSRQVLSRVLLVYARKDPVLAEVADFCSALNSFKEGRLDEPDYDRRLQAFSAIMEERETPFTPHQWRPMLFNMLFYIRHDEEFGILSSNSSDGICNFLDTTRAGPASSQEEVLSMLSTILLPALYAGARESSEVIRREYLKVMAHLVKAFPDWTEVNDMQGLLKGDDELESSFFNNILAPGKGRQSSALGQLAASAERGELSSRNVSHFFIPVIEHFIFDRAEGNEAHSLAAEATTTVGILAGSLEWAQYRALLRRFTGYVTAKPELEKQIIRLLGKTIDALALAADGRAGVSTAVETGEDITSTKHSSALSKSLPKESKFVEDLNSNVLPPLISYLHDKDESTVSLRVPVAVIIVRLLKLLPPEQMNEKLPGVLTDICHILRSKAQESRDMTRETLTKICVLLGPSCFGFVLKELRGALARGYQLHVLSYTMHSILVATTPEYAPGDLDYCLPSIVAIIMDDIFGVTGQEKDAEEYVSKMKEVKSSKSHDSMELIAKTATLSRLTDLVHPIQVLLKEKLDLRMVRKIDELLNRISTGLLKNPAAQSRDSLVFCYEVIQDVYKSNEPTPKVKENYRLKRYLVQKSTRKGGSRTSTTVYTFKLVRFAFDVLRAVLKKHDNLRTAANLAGFVPIIGDAVLQAEEEVKISAFKLLTTIVKVPFKNINDGTGLYRVASTEAARSISASSSMVSDISQAGLKLISVILRDRKDVEIKDTVVDTFLARLKEDLTNPERRHVTFNFLRAVLDSKVQTATVYDTLDYVGEIMVTNPDQNTRDLARGAYFQFIREYPQMKKRWSKQLSFIVTNLKYEGEGGRLSILEVIHLLLSKSSNEFVQEIAATCFVPLVFVLINDDSEKCRMAAGEVIKEAFRRADRDRLQTFSGLLRSWIQQIDNKSVLRLAFQCHGFYYESREKPDELNLTAVREAVQNVLQTPDGTGEAWELHYAALQLTSILCEKFPAKILAADMAELWTAVRSCLSYPHSWVKLSSARLCGIYFADFARTNAEDGLDLPLKGSNGLQLSTSDVKDLIRRTASIFKTPQLSELLATEAVKDLVFLGRCADASDLSWKVADNDVSDEEQEDEAQGKQTALDYLFARISFILRRETSPPRAPMLIPKTSALQLLVILCTKLSLKTVNSSLPTILLPLQHLTDPSIPTPYSTDDLFKTNYAALKSEAQELMSTLQTRCGTAVYTAQLLKVREGVKARREQRTTKRRIEAVTAPEKHGLDKKKKFERKKERRKEKGMEHRDQRRGY